MFVSRNLVNFVFILQYQERIYPGVMIRVTCALIEQTAKVLVTQRSRNMPQALLWEFPGGKIEASETEAECLVREIWEELSLHIQPLQRITPVLHPMGEAPKLELIPYRCHYVGGTIQLLEHRSYHWAHPHDLPKYNWCAPDLPVVAEYLRLIAGA